MVTGPFAPNSLALLSAALDYWTGRGGYAFVDLPWIVPEAFVALTRPPGAQDVTTRLGVLVASGEQSFLELAARGALRPAPGYIGWTPCYRDEPVLDRLHQFAFIKAELFVPVASSTQANTVLAAMLSHQCQLFGDLARRGGCVLRPGALAREVISSEQIDLVLNGIEVGSYGIRPLAQGGLYVYGTALALPRFTLALLP